MKTWLCPVAPELAALQASAAASQHCEQQRPVSARDCGASAYGNTWQLQAYPPEDSCDGEGNGSSTAVLPESLMLAGVRKMRPLSYTPAQPVSSSMPADGVVGMALTSRAARQQAVARNSQQAAVLSTGAERLLQEALLAGDMNGQRRLDFLQLVGDPSGSGGPVAGQGAAADAATCLTHGSSEGGVQAPCQWAELQPTFSAVRWTCRSSSPRRNTPRSARPASAAHSCSAGVHGGTPAQMSSRPHTARCHSQGLPGSGDLTAKKHMRGSRYLGTAESVAGGSLCAAQEVYAPSVAAGSRSVVRAGSATLKPAAVPRLNLGVLRL